MSQSSHCLFCFERLEARNVSPCTFCGGWQAAPVQPRDDDEYEVFRTDEGCEIVLCRSCRLEAFIVGDSGGQPCHPRMAPEFLGYLPGTELQDIFHYARVLDSPSVEMDKVCPVCLMRLGYMRIVESLQNRITQRNQ
jgi:hypothetical protein